MFTQSESNFKCDSAAMSETKLIPTPLCFLGYSARNSKVSVANSPCVNPNSSNQSKPSMLAFQKIDNYFDQL